MTALLDFPTVSELPVHGESALVPGTSLRLPLPPAVRDMTADQRCFDCAGTGVEFDRASGALMTCYCLEEPSVPEDEEPVIVVVGPFDLDRMPLAVLPAWCDPA